MLIVSEQAGRYQRSFSGLVGALVVTLVVITAFVVFRALNRDDLDVRPEPVDYLGSVKYIRQSGGSGVYPRTLPSGWVATSASYSPGRNPEWDLGVLTPKDKFVGLHLEDTSVEELVSDYVDKDAIEGDPIQLTSDVATTWRTFTDSGGDYALAAEIADQTLVVFGSADPSEIRDYTASLLTSRTRQPTKQPTQ
jgi:hypothetical protein